MAMSQQISVSAPAAVYDNQPQLQPPPGVSELFLYKNRLHSYVQKLGLPIPVYETQNEGAAHAPMFRVTVFVDNTHYTSQKVFTNKKYAEQETAKIALDALLNKISDEGFSFINEDTIFCKAVLNEYANKMHLDLPTYQTTTLGVVAFTSTLVFKGVTFTGQVARNKKEAEQFAARTAILSILGTPGPDNTLISNIIKSRYKPYAALYLGNNSTTSHVMPMSNGTGLNLGSPQNKGKEVMTTETTNDVATAAVIENTAGHIATIQVENQSCHEFKKPNLDTPTAPISPIIFVPPVHEQHMVSTPSSSKKRRKKEKKNHQLIAQPVVPSGVAIASPLLKKGKEREAMGAGKVENRLGQTAFIQIVHRPFHEAKKSRIDSSPIAAIAPNMFVPPAQQQPAVAGPSSSKKRRKKGKKVHQPTQFPQPMLPTSQFPCSVPQ